jgi:hypothetical protein
MVCHLPLEEAIYAENTRELRREMRTRSMKGLPKVKQRLRKLLRRAGACELCMPLLVTVPAGTLRTIQECPKCGREITLDVSNTREETQENLRIFARAVASVRNIPAVLFTITLNGKVLVDDPPCNCTPPCECYRMNLKFDAEDSIQPTSLE